MGAASWAIPVGVLAALSVVMFIFIWWWFPRHYRKGVKADQDQWDEERRQRDLRAVQNGEGGDVEMGADGVRVPAKTFVYTPPAYTVY